MGSGKQKQSAEETMVEALRAVAEASKDPLLRIGNGARLMVEYLTEQTRSVAENQNLVRQKIKDGSRLTKHRFTV